MTSCCSPDLERIFGISNQWCQKCSPLQIIEPLTEKTWGQGCVIFGERKNKERNGETPLRRRKYFEWIMKQLLNSAFVGYEEFCDGDLGGCYPPRSSAPVDNTLLDLQISLYPTQLRSIIANCYIARSLSDKINQIARCDWLAERARWYYLDHSRLHAVSREKNFPES